MSFGGLSAFFSIVFSPFSISASCLVANTSLIESASKCHTQELMGEIQIVQLMLCRLPFQKKVGVSRWVGREETTVDFLPTPNIKRDSSSPPFL